MKKYKLWVQIGFGFGVLLFIIVALGLLSIYDMTNAEKDVAQMSEDFMPQVAVANDLERYSLLTMMEMRAFGLTFEEGFLAQGRQYIEEVKKALQEAKTLADRSENLVELGSLAQAAEASLAQYESLINDTVATEKAIKQNRADLNAAAKIFMQASQAFGESLEAELKKNITEDAGKVILRDRVWKVNQGREILDLANAVRLIAWRSQAERNPQLIEETQRNFSSMAKSFEMLKARVMEKVQKKQIDDMSVAARDYQNAMNELAVNWNAASELAKRRNDAANEVLKAARNAAQAGLDHGAAKAQDTREVLDQASHIMIGGLLVAVLIGILTGGFITRGITKAMAAGVQFALAIKAGDLSRRLNMKRGDEIGLLANSLDEAADALEKKARLATAIADGDLTREVELASEGDVLGQALSNMVLSLNKALGQVNEAVAQTAEGSAQVSDSSQALSQGASEQAASLEEITSSMAELAAQTKTNAENASQANNLALAAKDSAQNGSREMAEMTEAMKSINDSSREIAKIIKAIDDIAFQTNLLALNAAVEAARAGKHGKGFAVVAQEVRNLAGRSAKAAMETSELIEESVKRAENGSGILSKTAESLFEIVNGATKVADLVGEIAAASNEQAQGITQVNQGLSQIEQVTQQNTANAEETASAAEELSSQAMHMREIVTQFHLKKELAWEGSPDWGAAAVGSPETADGRKPKQPVGPGDRVINPEDVISLEEDFGKY